MKTTVLSLVLVLGAVVAAKAIVIDFEEGFDGSGVGSFYDGVTFFNALFDGRHPDLAGLSGDVGLAHGEGDRYRYDASDPIVGRFDTPQSSVSIRALDVGSRGARIDLYDAAVGGNLIGYDEAFGPNIGVGFFFNVSSLTVPIMRFHLYQPSPPGSLAQDGMLWDLLSFDDDGVGQVPDAGATVLLLGLGLAVLSGLRTRL